MSFDSEPGTQRGVTYGYELLLDEHFQHLVQALLVKEYPGLQCLPVGMPDGGRDGFTLAHNNTSGVVLQVKFSRNPSKIEDPFKWVIDTIANEVPKLKQLEARGMSKYIFVSNVPGTSHLDSGTIDKVNNYLNSHISGQGQCLWRDDLDRRLDGSYDLKLRFPHILNGPDFLRLLWESSGNETVSRRRGAVEAYLRDQYLTDENLRFKQVEMLTTKLFDLYIDVPIRPLVEADRLTDKRPYEARRTSIAEDIALAVEARANGPRRRAADSRGRQSIQWPGAAQLICDQVQSAAIRKLVIEGAPGQGKTTLTQYLAQIQRARFLKKNDELERLPSCHTNGPVLLPLKIELRDLSRWLNGRDPWDSDDSAVHAEIPSLESALAAHIRRYSGGSSFSVDDLRALLAVTPCLIMLDALDEVADLTDRKKVVAEIEAASERLQVPGADIIVLITSRPTAISSAPKIDRTKFVHYNLQPIRTVLALEYANQWSAARGLLTRDANELQKILRNKLESTHMAELAKNTMQLTILLSLVLSRGSSLPDKRTELYTSYLELFLSRESDKSEDVRDNRPLILDLHGYLAYYLHARAEEQRSTGRIGSDELRKLVGSYLQLEGHDPELTQRLFDALVQRVVAIVSRVEGTFEFEVQPIREYFAARHLYTTAPYSPPGRERKGTKPDRFDGIAPNPYWMNVTRFYAGFFSKGEIMDLAHRVCNLIVSTDAELDFYPRRLALALLQDWVFAQVPSTVKMVVERLLDDAGIIWAANLHTGRYLANDVGEFQLWPGGGGAEYASQLIWNRIIADSANDWAYIWCSLIQAVDVTPKIHQKWSEHYRTLKSTKNRTRWAQIADHLRVTSSLTAIEYSSTLQVGTSKQLGERALALRGAEDHFNFLPREEQNLFVQSILGLGSSRPLEIVSRSSGLSGLLAVTHPQAWIMYGLRDRWHEAMRASVNNDKLMPFNDLLQKMALAYSQHSNRELEPWERMVTLLESQFSRNLSSIQISALAAGIVSKDERGQGAHHLIDDELVSLPRRFRYARIRGGKESWWIQQFDRITSSLDAQIWSLALVYWSSSDLIIRLARNLDRAIALIPAEARDKFVGGILTAPFPRRRESVLIDSIPSSDRLSYSTLMALGERASDRLTADLCLRLSSGLPKRQIAAFVLPRIVDRVIRGKLDNESFKILQDCMDAGEPYMMFERYGHHVYGQDDPGVEILRSALRQGGKYPPSLTGVAFSLHRRSSTSRAISVDKIATREEWFSVKEGDVE
ncbi:NACHT domain-containing NTPase [Amycolatopsis sp. BJA-103]|uniref:NACHT domain-containing protein n=1 Tax=Amycolatopsis sp. BJA-103 TaxID=1911175 RepID=UPI0011AF4E29|nr:hypothetical protein [Amycolatopsis sp. BJA-103]